VTTSNEIQTVKAILEIASDMQRYPLFKPAEVPERLPVERELEYLSKIPVQEVGQVLVVRPPKLSWESCGLLLF
jgi:hypothetical protein